MESTENHKHLQWILQQIESETPNIQNISFYLSQPTSTYHKETETSIKLKISKQNHTLFLHLLTQLSSITTITSTLRSLEFHHVEWELQHLESLKSFFLENNNSDFRRILFMNNKFNVKSLKELSELLKKDHVIRQIIFSESRIGETGAGLLASALKVNDSIEEVQIWEDSIGLRGAEELSKMIEANSSLKLLTVFDSSWLSAAPLISPVLARNRATEVHVWSGQRNGKKMKISKVVEFVPEDSTLRVYKLDLFDACRISCALEVNTTVTSLDMTGIKLRSRWAKEFRRMLEQNTTLREVKLSKCHLKNKSIVYIAAGLFKNKKLETLYLDGNSFSGAGIEHLLCPLTRFSTLQYQANITLKSITFGGKRTKIRRDGLAAILGMLTSNESLTRLGIYDDESLGPEGIVKMVKSLEKNMSLKSLSLRGCKGVQGDLVLETIMGMLQVNPWIEDIDLARTPLCDSGKAEGIYQKLGQNAKSEEEPDVDLFRDMPMTVPKSCRVFLCGQEHAGKTTLCNSISNNFSSTKHPYLDQVRTLVNPVEQAVKTEGMNIRTLRDEDTKISIWNIAGHHELYSLHDLMFPGHGSASLFLIILSLFRKPSSRDLKDPTEIEDDLHYWLRFLISNSKKSVQQCMLPNVAIVLTHYDKITPSSHNLQDIVDSIQRLRDKFQGFLEFYPTVFTVDARSSASVSKLTQHIRNTSKTILQRVPRVYQLCYDITQILMTWRSENHNKPAMSWKEYGELCQVKVPSLRIRSRGDNKEKTEMRRRTIASCLHHIGEVIYFDDDPGLLVLDFEWFCDEVLGQLVQLGRGKRQGSVKDGFVSRKELERILKGSLQSQIPGMGSKVFGNMEAHDIVMIMLKLDLCFEQDPSDANSQLLVPSLLEDGRQRIQKWQFSTPECVFSGRHLECDDSSHMCLTPGFFPRLQVHLCNKIMALKNQHGGTYSLEKHLISININGVDVRVELGGQFGYYIDILACSTKNLTETLRLYHQLIIPSIQSLCQGILLIESVIRPECVRNLTPPRYRKTQLMSLHQLKEALLSVPADSIYDYQHTWSAVSDTGSKTILRAGFDYARDLLSDEDFREVLHRRYHDLYNLASELQVPTESDPEASTSEETANSIIDPSLGGIAKGVEQVLQRLKIIEQEIRDLKQEIQGLRYYEHRLLIELHRKVDHLVNYNVQLEERKAPNIFFFVRAENYSRRLVTTIIPGMDALRLHMLCEFRREMHVVEDQMGCEVMQVDNKAVKCLAPYMTGFMKLLTFALKIGTHLATGMGSMIPDLSKEVAHLVDSSALTGTAGAAAAGAVGAMAIGSSMRQNRSRDIQQDQRAAQQWVLDFLRDRKCASGRDIAEKFGLWRVRYRDSGQIAWICRRHLSLRAHEIVQVPI